LKDASDIANLDESRLQSLGNISQAVILATATHTDE